MYAFLLYKRGLSMQHGETPVQSHMSVSSWGLSEAYRITVSVNALINFCPRSSTSMGIWFSWYNIPLASLLILERSGVRFAISP